MDLAATLPRPVAIARASDAPASRAPAPHAPAALLAVRDLTLETAGPRPLRLVDTVSLTVGRGEALAVVGESGCGKTLTCLALMGLQPAGVGIVAGSARLGDVELVGRRERDWAGLRGRRIAMIFQDATSALNPVHRIGDTLTASLRRHRGLDRTAAAAEARRLLDRVGIPRPADRLGAFPHEMSGGMNQRVMIALALTGEPDLLIADEPTTALDVTMQRQVLDLIAEIRRDSGMALILISHDLGVVAEVADRVAVMYCGRVVEHAATADLLGAPRHPYTAGLIASMPPDPMAAMPRAVAPIRGAVAGFADLPSGCHFRPRCDRAAAICATGRPPARGDGARDALCHFPLDVRP